MKKTAAVMTALSLAALMGYKDPVSNTDPPEVRFQAVIDGAQSRAAGSPIAGEERAVGSSWTAGDAIGVSMLERGGEPILPIPLPTAGM